MKLLSLFAMLGTAMSFTMSLIFFIYLLWFLASPPWTEHVAVALVWFSRSLLTFIGFSILSFFIMRSKQ